MKSLVLLPLLLCPLLVRAAPEDTRFLRVEETAEKAQLQTAVSRYEKGDAAVELIGAVHIADRTYYEKLNARFASYDALLFEMIGGADIGKVDPDAKEEGGVHAIYAMVSRFLKLESQMAWIDYTPANFVHADLSLEEFRRLQTERGESVLGFAMKAGKGAPADSQPDMRRLMTAFLAGNADALKLELIHTLGAGDDQIRAFAGESVIIGDRNARALDVLSEQLALGRKNVGIFYGAAHFPDMEKRLLNDGWKLVRQEWITAWDVKKPKPAAQPVEGKDAA